MQVAERRLYQAYYHHLAQNSPHFSFICDAKRYFPQVYFNLIFGN